MLAGLEGMIKRGLGLGGHDFVMSAGSRAKPHGERGERNRKHQNNL